MNTFNLKIVSFEKIFLDEPVTYCAIYTSTGKIGFKANHEAFMSVLKENSQIEYTLKSGSQKKVALLNGLFTFKDNACTITIFQDNE
jgi:F0F1-type ATP synthase epsilon subunit